MSHQITEKRARRLLPHTWHAFFGRFGRLTDTQAAAIEPIVSGHSLVLCAPTASGKTEAVVGPLIDRLIQLDRTLPGPRLLVICPTRALCNDLHRRIHRPIARCGWSSDIKTADSPSLSTDDPPHVLVTTPESFDSLLSRRAAFLRNVGALFLDELHLLDGGPRGDHLKALTFRLKSFRKNIQICAASATAADAKRLALEFGGAEARVVQAGGGRDRKMDPRLLETVTLPQAARVIEDHVQEKPSSKILVFANTRAEVEWLATALSELRAFAHHGSLSKAQRLRTEQGFLRAPSGICVATMTLELGVDIGDVDRVVLLNPPPNVASFTQRIGRSNRRGGRIQTTCLYSTPFDRMRFEHMISCAEEGRLFPENIPFRPTIIPQQAVSLAFQNPNGHWVSAKALHARLPPALRPVWTTADCTQILEMMRKDGYLHADSHGRYVADDPAEQDYRYGRMHAHFASSGEIEVVDEATGRKIGTAKWDSQDQSRSETGDEFLLGGRQRKVTRVRDGQLFVEAGELGEDAQFLSRMGPRYSFDLARDLASFLEYPDDEIHLDPRGARKWHMDHFFGTLWGYLLSTVMRARGFRVKKVTPFFAECSLRSGKLPTSLGEAAEIEDDVHQWLQTGYKQLLGPLEAGPWRRFVPEKMLRRWVIDCVRPAEFADRLADFRLVEGK